MENIELHKSRYERAGFFLFSVKMPENARRVFGTSELLNLLQGLHGGKWPLVKLVVRYFIQHRYIEISVDLKWFWHTKILRKTPEQMDELIDREFDKEPTQ